MGRGGSGLESVDGDPSATPVAERAFEMAEAVGDSRVAASAITSVKTANVPRLTCDRISVAHRCNFPSAPPLAGALIERQYNGASSSTEITCAK